jgi:hypothetical protein
LVSFGWFEELVLGIKKETQRPAGMSEKHQGEE